MLATLADQCGGEIASADLLAALKAKTGVDGWLQCDPKCVRT